MSDFRVAVYPGGSDGGTFGFTADVSDYGDRPPRTITTHWRPKRSWAIAAAFRARNRAVLHQHRLETAEPCLPPAPKP